MVRLFWLFAHRFPIKLHCLWWLWTFLWTGSSLGCQSELAHYPSNFVLINLDEFQKTRHILTRSIIDRYFGRNSPNSSPEIAWTTGCMLISTIPRIYGLFSMSPVDTLDNNLQVCLIPTSPEWLHEPEPFEIYWQLANSLYFLVSYQFGSQKHQAKLQNRRWNGL